MKNLPPVQLSLFSQDDADSILNPHYTAFEEFMFGAWKDWESVPVAQRTQLSPRARAACVYDFIVNRAKTYFSKVKGADLVVRRGLILFGLDGKVLLRFKKLNKNKKASNILTNQQIEFSLQRTLPGIPPQAARLIVGYQLNEVPFAIELGLSAPHAGSLLFLPLP